MTITVSSSDPRSVKALEVLMTSDRWVKAHRKADGRPFFVIPSSSDPDRVYWTGQTSCTCLDAARRGVTCKHQLAVRLWNAREQARARQARLSKLRLLVANV